MSIWNKLGLASKKQLDQLNQKIDQLIELQQLTDQSRIEKVKECEVREVYLNEQLSELQSKLIHILYATKEADIKTNSRIEDIRKLLDQHMQFICSKLDKQTEEIQYLKEAMKKLNNIYLPDISQSISSLEEIIRITLVNKLITDIEKEYVSHNNL